MRYDAANAERRLTLKEYTYRGYTFRKTSTTTTVYVSTGHGETTQKLAYLYEIDDLKERGKRPFLTTVEQCKEYIRDHVEEC